MQILRLLCKSTYIKPIPRIVSPTTFRRSMSVSTITQELSKLGLNQPKPAKDTYPDYNVVDVFRNYIGDELSRISGIEKDIIVQALDTPKLLDQGDLIVPIPKLRLKGVNPSEKSKEWAEKFNKSKFISDLVPQGVFLQFFFNKSVLFDLVISDVLKRKTDYGYLPLGVGKKVVVEFSSPNIAKPFHAGHLRSTIIGGFVSNLYEKIGWDVTRINYLGDWGKQFGLLAIGFERYGSEEELAKDPINHLFEVYVKINNDVRNETSEATGEAQEGAIDASEQDEKKIQSSTNEQARAFFRRMEDGDEAALKIWERFRDLSIEKYVDTYARLNIVYDYYSGESQVPQQKMKDATKLFEEKGLVHVDRGAKLIDLSKFNKKLGKALVEKSDGTSLYLTRDVGEAIKRYETYKFDKMIYVVASQQDLHCAQFFEILKQMGFDWAQNLEHINFGMVQGMSTRKGNVVFLDNILQETKEKMHDVMKKNEDKYKQIEDPEKIADLVGISAVMIQDFQSKRILNYEFKWDRMTSFEGDTGPYLQYAHSRLCSMQRKNDITEKELESANFDLLVEPCAASLIRTLAQYPDTIRRATKNMEPSTIVTYLFTLTHIVSQCYDILWVSGQEKELAVARLALYAATRQVIYNGMTLLGLTPVERM
ncbi:tRNA-Arg synthetase [Candida orthopsilosis Co 90-125]|uniref:arginine--tRNA ligase n=1 Tax=Candida orthopsilosis (strain 90-125) TaxID=1136231 RepID=H8X219_CANO9|nr:tRNA-Arg synthetase [Candida orthopsilosis Co 90-125]CCG22740.1 tRNA-Arg synthetase [Candida orthopsilosis Co 90-125]